MHHNEAIKMFEDTQNLSYSRVVINDEMIRKLLGDINSGQVCELANNLGLPYTLIYNLVNGRIHSLSTRDYRIIFREAPSYQTHERVDGFFFRGMVRLWLFMDDHASKAGLFREFYPNRKKVDYRLFSGRVKTVERRIEELMEQKFYKQGLNRSDIQELVEELDRSEEKKRIDYEKIKPVLTYLDKTLKAISSRLLNQAPARFESGELKTVSELVYHRACRLKELTEKAVHSGSKLDLERIREMINGRRKGMTLYAEIEGELKLLKRCGGKSPKVYLGRTMNHYEKGNLKRIASWRAKKIHQDYVELIKQNPDIPISPLPGFHITSSIKALILALKAVLVKKMLEDESRSYEKSVLMPAGGMNAQLCTFREDLISIQGAACYIGMAKNAFDQMVAENREIFRRLAVRCEGKWYLPVSFLDELNEKRDFVFIKEKYEFLADRLYLSPENERTAHALPIN